MNSMERAMRSRRIKIELLAVVAIASSIGYVLGGGFSQARALNRESAGRPDEAVRALPEARRGTRAAAGARARARKALRSLGADLSRQAAELKFIEAITAGGPSGEPETPGASR